MTDPRFDLCGFPESGAGEASPVARLRQEAESKCCSFVSFPTAPAENKGFCALAILDEKGGSAYSREKGGWRVHDERFHPADPPRNGGTSPCLY